MIVKANKKEWEVNDCTYKQRRELHKLNAMAWWNKKLNPEKYYDLLERVSDISGLTEEDFEGMSMDDIDRVLQEVFVSYLSTSKK